MRVLVTGYDGFIGRHVARQLQDAGHDVTGIDQPAYRPYPLVCEGYCADLSNPLWLNDYSGRNLDAIIHLASLTSVPDSVADPNRYYWQNMNMTMNVIRFARTHGIKKIVFASSAAVYGNDFEECVEDSKMMPCNPYGRTKAWSEEMFRDSGVDTTILRLFNVVGPGYDYGRPRHLLPSIYRSFLRNEPFTLYGCLPDTNNAPIRDYVDVRDVARAFVLALRAGPTTCNIGSGIGTDNFTLYRMASYVALQDYPPCKFGPWRDGDPRMLLANTDRAVAALGWTNLIKFTQTLRDTWIDAKENCNP